MFIKKMEKAMKWVQKEENHKVTIVHNKDQIALIVEKRIKNHLLIEK